MPEMGNRSSEIGTMFRLVRLDNQQSRENKIKAKEEKKEG